MTDTDALALELRATAPAAPERLRARVDVIAARTPPAPASWRAWFQPRRAVLIAAPTAVAVMLAVAVVHGISSSPTRSDASRGSHPDALTSGVGGAENAPPTRGVRGLPAASPRAVRAQHAPFAPANTDRAAKTPPPAQGRAQDYRATLTVRLPGIDRMSDAMKTAIRKTRAWGGYVVTADYNAGSHGDAQLTVRIPVQHVQAAIQQFAELGTLAAQDVSIRDVQATLDRYTREWLSTRERIAKLKVKLTRAQTDAQRASLELQIAQAQKAAARLRAEQVALKRQASFANVTLTLTTRNAAAAAPHKEGRIERTLGDAVSILALELVFVLYGLIVIAPFALVAAAVFFAARAGRRRADDRLLGST